MITKETIETVHPEGCRCGACMEHCRRVVDLFERVRVEAGLDEACKAADRAEVAYQLDRVARLVASLDD